MSKTLLASAVALALVAGPALAFAQAPAAAPAAAAGKLSSKSAIKDLLSDPKAAVVLNKHIPVIAEFFASGQAEAVVPGTTSLAELATNPQAESAGLTADTLKAIDDDLAKL